MRNNRRFRTEIIGGQSFCCREASDSDNSDACNHFAFKFNKKFNQLKILLIFFLLITVIFFSTPVSAHADSEEDAEESITSAIEKVISSLDLSDIEDVFDDLDIGYTFSDLIKNVINGNISNFTDGFLSVLSGGLRDEISSFAPEMASVLAIILLLALIDGLKANALNKSVTEISAFVCNFVVIGLIAIMFVNLYKSTDNTVTTLTTEIQTVFPLILTLMTAAGGSSGVAALQPSVAILCNIVSGVFTKFLFPIVLFIFAFNALNAFSSSLKLDKTTDFFKSIFKWIVGLSTVFFGFFITAQGIATSVSDNVSIKALKYAVGSSLPIISNLLSSGFDVFVASCILVKNACGTLSLVFIFYMIISPVIKCVVFCLCMRSLAAVAQPVAFDGTAKFLSGAADAATYLASIIAVIAILYMLTIVVVMCCLGGAM